MLYFILVKFDLLILGFAIEIDEDEMSLLVELWGEDCFLHQKHLHHFHVEADFLFDLSSDGVYHAFSDFDVSAGESVLVEPFVRLRQQDLPFAVDDQSSYSWFWKHLLYRRLGEGWSLVGRGQLRSVVVVGSTPFFSSSRRSLFIPSQSLAICPRTIRFPEGSFASLVRSASAM